MKIRDIVALGGIVALTVATSLTGARVTRRRGTKAWYRILRKPPQTPPDAVFGVVWPVLYGMSAASGYRAWKVRAQPGGRKALALWGTQLALNAAWTPLFFGQHRSRAALVDLGLTFAALAEYTRTIGKLDRPAAWLMVPYLGWLGFASTLNAGIVHRNPRLLSG